MTRARLALASLSFSSLLAACAGDRFSHARTYVPLAEEEKILRSAQQDAVYDDVRRMPEQYQSQPFAWFGVITSVTEAGDTVRVKAQLRSYRERHLCADETESSCSVTVGTDDGGVFTVIVKKSDTNGLGTQRFVPSMLLRVYGTVAAGEKEDDGGPVLTSRFYRVWPRQHYVTTAMSGELRQ